MHNYDLVHRDLNPINIFYGEGRIQIVDFSFITFVKDNPYHFPR